MPCIEFWWDGVMYAFSNNDKKLEAVFTSWLHTEDIEANNEYF